MTTAGSKILSGAREALAIARGEADAARVMQRGEDGRMHDITAEWNRMNRSKTPERLGGASAGIDMTNEAGHPAAPPPAIEGRS